MNEPSFKIEVAHDSSKYGWTVSLWRQEKKYAKWVKLGQGQGQKLSEALGAVQHLATQQEKQHPELF